MNSENVNEDKIINLIMQYIFAAPPFSIIFSDIKNAVDLIPSRVLKEKIIKYLPPLKKEIKKLIIEILHYLCWNKSFGDKVDIKW